MGNSTEHSERNQSQAGQKKKQSGQQSQQGQPGRQDQPGRQNQGGQGSQQGGQQGDSDPMNRRDTSK